MWRKGTLLHYWWECKLVQPLWRTVWRFLKKLEIELPYDPARRRQWQPTPVLLPGKSHGWRGLVGCSPWGHWESNTTERLHFHFSLSCNGEGNGNPLQCSCLENARDGEPGGLPSMRSQIVGKQLGSSSNMAVLLPVF